jgi:hypothetical protein
VLSMLSNHYLSNHNQNSESKVRRKAAVDAFTAAATPPPPVAMPAITPGNAAAVGATIANM